jgi:2-iminobutanoate/2-iminopropanoate deaminase
MRKLGLAPTLAPTLALALTLGFAAPALADKVLVESPDAPKAIGPYSQAIRSGNLVFVSGSLPFDPAGKIDYSQQDVAVQTKRALDNIALTLKAANLTLDDVVSATVYVTDVEDFPAVNKVYASYFHAPYPARAFVQVAKLLRGAKVEISVIAAAR